MQKYKEFLGKFYYLLHPRITVLITTYCPNKRINVMPASWNTPVSEYPPTIGIAIDKQSFTRECLDFSGEATINVPSVEQINLVYTLGSVSGRYVDKVSVYNLKLIESRSVRSPGIDGSLAILEGRVINKVEIGDVVFYVFEILNSLAHESLVDEFGYNLAITSVLLHGSGKVFYKVDPRKLWAKKI